MSCINTYTKQQFDPCEPDSALIVIEDIAHALSLLCRSGGHFPAFYSVGQHCISCADEAAKRGYTKKVQLACLLHDASEAYISDITRPVKQRLSEYKKFEKALQNVIYQKFLGFIPDDEMQKLIADVDDTMLYHEFMHFMNIALFDAEPKILSKPDYNFYGFEQTEKDFLVLYQKLSA
ncbi:MAG: phosphohydrolase [Ruminococcus sp.]|nr:phosphohydrolase [Ruminococcus sp.]